MKKIVCIILLFVISYFLPPRNAFASDFLVDYDVSYAVSLQGRTQVTQKISLLNKKTNLYAKEYAIVIDSTKIHTVTASDNKGAITPSIEQKGGKTEIRLTFNDEVVGQGKILNFTLKYVDENIAKKNGAIWEISIPGIAEDSDLGQYVVNLSVPKEFGPPAYLVPQPQEDFHWKKEQLINGGVNAAFGEKQIFELTLSYFLENSKSTGITTELALPPTTAYQYITLDSIEPTPSNVVLDSDGNWLGRYELGPNETQVVRATLLAELSLHPRKEFTDVLLDTSQWLNASQHWQVSDPEIVLRAKDLKTPKDIYTYVMNTLDYDYTRVNENNVRKGALESLKTPKNSVCMEYTDLFITLSRAAGIPARQAVGFAYTTNAKLRPLSLVSDVLHAWPEYYDSTKKLWVPIDPTWGDTTGGIDYFDKLDFNHIVFSYNGLDDTYPYPAGFYRPLGKSGKDVEVRFRDHRENVEEVLPNLSFSFPKTVTAGFTTTGVLDVFNAGKRAAENTTIRLESPQFGLSKLLPSKTIPPFGHIEIPFGITLGNYFQSGTDTITASINGKSVVHTVRITPAYHVLAPIIIGIIWIVIVCIILVRKYKKI